MQVIGSSRSAALSWGERFAALKYLPRFVELIYRSHPQFTILIALVSLLRACFPIALLWVGKLIVDVVELHHRTGSPVEWSFLGRLIALELILALGGEASARASSLLTSLLGDVFATKMTIRIMTHASCLDLAQFENSTTYDLLARARNRTTGGTGVFGQLLDTVQSLVTLVSLVTALAVFVPWLLVLLSLAVLPSFFGETHFVHQGYSLLQGWTPERRKLDYIRFVAASDQTAKELKLFQLSSYLIGRFASLAWRFCYAQKRLLMRQAIVSTMLSAIGTVGYYGAYAIIIFLATAGNHSTSGITTIGTLTFLAASFRLSRERIQHVLMCVSGIYEQSLHASDLLRFLELQPTITSRPSALQIPRHINEGFVFENVGFRYPQSKQWAVHNLSFRIRPRESVALVGENGAGKTTIAKLLARLYDPDEGRILLDGVDLRDYDLNDLWRNVAVVFQDFVRYSFLFKENIGVGDVTRIHDDEQIREASRRGLANAVAERLTLGFEQQLGREFDNGVDLSGGEWQKVALSRAHMRPARVLILDEPTAALDARAEYAAFRRVTDLAGGKITLIISHRFSTVRMADRILVLEGGRLAEQGVHSELLTHGGIYANLFRLQAVGYR